MAIKYSYDPVTDGVTDASANYMNKMQTGIKSACDGIDVLNSDLASKLLLSLQKWSGTNTADDYRNSNNIVYCNPSWGNLTNLGFPSSSTGILTTLYIDGITYQSYWTHNNKKYERTAVTGSAPTAWVER